MVEYPFSFRKIIKCILPFLMVFIHNTRKIKLYKNINFCNIYDIKEYFSYVKNCNDYGDNTFYCWVLRLKVGSRLD